MSEDEKPFSVSDRRHFTAEGDVRKSDADDAAPAPEKGSESAAAADVSPLVGAPADATAGPASAERPAGAAPREERGGQGPAGEERGGQFPRDFLGLVISLGAQASMLLMGGPEGEPPELESAQSLIELLGNLKEKTEGRRTAQEDQLLDGLLYELRMAYVQATKAGGR